jgi:hypothetical protein
MAFSHKIKLSIAIIAIAMAMTEITAMETEEKQQSIQWELYLRQNQAKEFWNKHHGTTFLGFIGGAFGWSLGKQGLHNIWQTIVKNNKVGSLRGNFLMAICGFAGSFILPHYGFKDLATWPGWLGNLGKGYDSASDVFLRHMNWREPYDPEKVVGDIKKDFEDGAERLSFFHDGTFRYNPQLKSKPKKSGWWFW